MKKVNLGCGTTCLMDWINIDSSFNAKLAKFPQVRYLLYKLGFLSEQSYKTPWKDCIDYIKIHDLKNPLPFNNSSVDFVYTSHFLEHLSRYEAEALLKECHRVLKAEGVIRIVVPDLRLLVKKYIEDISKDYSNSSYIPSDIFFENLRIVDKRRSSFLNIFLYQNDNHRWMYDEDSLRHMLKNAGFGEIEKKCYREGKVPDIEYLDNRPKESLYMEGTKKTEIPEYIDINN